jgi:hypothetical protein
MASHKCVPQGSGHCRGWRRIACQSTRRLATGMRPERKKYRQRDHCARRNYGNHVLTHLANMCPGPHLFQPGTLPQSSLRTTGFTRLGHVTPASPALAPIGQKAQPATDRQPRRAEAATRARAQVRALDEAAELARRVFSCEGIVIDRGRNERFRRLLDALMNEIRAHSQR